MHVRQISTAMVFAAGCASACWHINGFAVDAASLEFATGNRSTITRLGAQWDWTGKWLQTSGAYLGGYWDLTGAQFHENRYQNVVGRTANLYDVGITPVFRFQNSSKLGFYGEAGIGAHVFSQLYDNNKRRFSTAFEFGDHVGVGYVFTDKIEVGVKLQHFSNGGIKHPNSGANFAVAKVAYRF